MLRLLCVTAHPDDEAGGFGGALRLYADRGVEVSVICMTDGSAASNRGTATTTEELVRLRKAEFERACAMLGVKRAEMMGLPDKQLERHPFDRVAGELVRRVRDIRPHVMLTFGTEGAVTAHPDHSMASLFATAAYHWAGRADRFQEQLSDGKKPWRTQKLYYGTVDFFLPDRPPTSPAPWTAVIEIGEEKLRLKQEAFAAHTTQNPLLERFRAAVRQRGTRELYHLANSIHQHPMKMETDLFENVEERFG